MKYTYKPQNVCSTKFIAEIENNIIIDFIIEGGCPGNTKAVCQLIKGKKVNEVIDLLKGIDCRAKGTSCPDQISKFLQTIK
jgi:uncharacterized protein (TIGR03905 family)